MNKSISETNFKLSRDDDQVLALNYENLCDLEYLNRLLGSEQQLEDQNEYSESYKPIEKEIYSNVFNNSIVQQFLLSEIPEDILLQSDEKYLGY